MAEGEPRAFLAARAARLKRTVASGIRPDECFFHAKDARPDAVARETNRGSARREKCTSHNASLLRKYKSAKWKFPVFFLVTQHAAKVSCSKVLVSCALFPRWSRHARPQTTGERRRSHPPMLSRQHSLNSLLRHAAAASSRYAGATTRPPLPPGRLRVSFLEEELHGLVCSGSASATPTTSPRTLLRNEQQRMKATSSLRRSVSASSTTWSHSDADHALRDDEVVTDAARHLEYPVQSPEADRASNAQNEENEDAPCDKSRTRGKKDDALARVLRERLDEMRRAGTYKRERVIASPQETEILTVQQTEPDNARGVQTTRAVLNFCANNYLGLSNHPALVKAAKQALDARGHGMSSVRFICGTQDAHRDLERKIAAFHGTEDAILYPSCFDANAGLFEAIVGPEDAVVSDALNHASLIDGIRLCKARRFVYDHADMISLERRLVEAKDARVRLVVTDGQGIYKHIFTHPDRLFKPV